jgi:hypothetical protein
MPSCNICKKVLSTQQALSYHLNNKVCRPTDNVKSEQNEYDFIFECNLEGRIIESSDEIHKGKQFYMFICNEDKYFVAQVHIQCLVSKSICVANFRLNNNFLPICGVFHNVGETLYIKCKKVKLNVSDLYCILNIDFTFSYLSPVFEEMYECNLTQLKDNNYIELWNKNRPDIVYLVQTLTLNRETVQSYITTSSKTKTFEGDEIISFYGNFYIVYHKNMKPKNVNLNLSWKS